MCEPMTHNSAKRYIKLLRNWDYLCVICGRPFRNLACVTVEHLVPRSQAGEKIRKPKKSDNLAPSHWRCNMLRRTASILAAGAKIAKAESLNPSPESFMNWLNRPVPRKGVSPWYCFIPVVDAEWMFL